MTREEFVKRCWEIERRFVRRGEDRPETAEYHRGAGGGASEVAAFVARELPAILQTERDVMRMEAAAWARERWEGEVKHRPAVNVHRRALDTTWRQVIRHFDPDSDGNPEPSPLAEPAKKEIP